MPTTLDTEIDEPAPEENKIRLAQKPQTQKKRYTLNP